MNVVTSGIGALLAEANLNQQSPLQMSRGLRTHFVGNHLTLPDVGSGKTGKLELKSTCALKGLPIRPELRILLIWRMGRCQRQFS